MRPESRKYLWDALTAADLIADFVAGKDFDGRTGGIHGYATVDDQVVWGVIAAPPAEGVTGDPVLQTERQDQLRSLAELVDSYQVGGRYVMTR